MVARFPHSWSLGPLSYLYFGPYFLRDTLEEFISIWGVLGASLKQASGVTGDQMIKRVAEPSPNIPQLIPR
jgi:hypothetical protein